MKANSSFTIASQGLSRETYVMIVVQSTITDADAKLLPQESPVVWKLLKFPARTSTKFSFQWQTGLKLCARPSNSQRLFISDIESGRCNEFKQTGWESSRRCHGLSLDMAVLNSTRGDAEITLGFKGVNQGFEHVFMLTTLNSGDMFVFNPSLIITAYALRGDPRYHQPGARVLEPDDQLLDSWADIYGKLFETTNFSWNLTNAKGGRLELKAANDKSSAPEWWQPRDADEEDQGDDDDYDDDDDDDDDDNNNDDDDYDNDEGGSAPPANLRPQFKPKTRPRK